MPQLAQHFSTRTSDPVLRVPLYPANSSLSFWPGSSAVLAQHPSRFRFLDDARDPRFQEIRHAADPPAFFVAGHSW